MALLPIYKTEKEKKVVFRNCVFCDSELEMSAWLQDLDDGKFDGAGMSFRGMTRASYKLYSSLQRMWIEGDLEASHPEPKILVQRILDASFRRGVGGTLLPNGARDDFAMLSYLQHHGCPTPLLDFTSDIQAALYFATQEPKESATGSELDDYFSIYVLHPQVIDAMNGGLKKTWIQYSPGQREETARWFRSHEMNSQQDTLIFQPEWISRLYGEGVVNLSTSDRFRLQAGLFAMNNTADLPFPEAIHAFVAKRTWNPLKRRSVRTWVTSLNIKRKHVEVVKEWLASKKSPLTRDHLLPEREKKQWVTEVFDEVLKRTSGGGQL